MKKMKVIDISYANPDVDFVKVKAAGIPTVIIGNGYYGKTDTDFNKHISNAIKADMDIGTYTYIMSDTVAQARKEAQQTLERLKPYRGFINYPVFCDMECSKYYDDKKYSDKLRTDIIKAFCEEIRKGGYYPAVYINPSWLEEWTNKKEILGVYDIWLAAWTENESKDTRYDYGQTMWQWGTKRVNGIKGDVDSNFCYIDYPAKIRKAGLNFLPPENAKRKKVQEIYYSYGTAAIRSTYSREQDNILSRCEKGKYYAADRIVEVDGVTWLGHVGGGYSMLKDGPILFKLAGTYKEGVTTARLNVRTAPAVKKSTEYAVLEKGATVYLVSGKESGWYAVVYDGKEMWVSADYVKTDT